MQIGFIGLGHMGSAISANLLRAGHDVAVYNRTRAKADALSSLGAKVAGTPGEAAKGDVVFTMLADDKAVEDVVFDANGILAHMKSGAVHVSMSTISAAFSKRLAEAHAKAGQRYVATPVLGRPDAAAAAKLFIVAAGAADAVKTVAPLLDVIGQRTFAISEQADAANVVKLSCNFLIATVIESLGETMALTSKAGIDKHAFLEILTSTLFSAPIYKTYGNLIADEKFKPAGFAAPLGLKDIRLALAAGEDLRVPLPIASLLRDRFLTLLAQGGDDLDWSAVGGLAAKDAGSA